MRSNNDKLYSINKGPNLNALFAMKDRIPVNQCSTVRDALGGNIMDETILSKTFFSKENQQIIQNGIRAGVYAKSNGHYIVGKQDCDTLAIIMRSVFLQHSLNQPSNIKEQIEGLNELVLKYCIETVYSEAKGHINYLKDTRSLKGPNALPVSTTTEDRRTKRNPSWF